MNKEIKEGSLVRAGYQGGPMIHTGIVTQIIEDYPYGCELPESLIHILCSGRIKIFSLEEDNVKVI
jgi:hypothetical protein